MLEYGGVADVRGDDVRAESFECEQRIFGGPQRIAAIQARSHEILSASSISIFTSRACIVARMFSTAMRTPESSASDRTDFRAFTVLQCNGRDSAGPHASPSCSAWHEPRQTSRLPDPCGDKRWACPPSDSSPLAISQMVPMPASIVTPTRSA